MIANTMATGDGIYDLTIQEARQYQSELAKNGINSVITTNPNDRSDYLVTASQSAAFAAMSLDTNSEQAIEQSREIMEDTLVLLPVGRVAMLLKAELGMATGAKIVTFSVTGASLGGVTDYGTQVGINLFNQYYDYGSVDFVNALTNIDKSSVAISSMMGSVVGPKILQLYKATKYSIGAKKELNSQIKSSKTQNRINKLTDRANKHTKNIVNNGRYFIGEKAVGFGAKNIVNSLEND